MGNYKVRVNSEAESREAQELFLWLGLKRNSWHDQMKAPLYICNWIKGEFSNYSLGDRGLGSVKEITLPELRDLVVLKRNDVNDATHVDKQDEAFKYRMINNHWHVITEEEPVWRRDSIELNEATLFIKPMEKPMDILDTEHHARSINDQYAEIEQVRQAIKVKSGSDSDHSLDAMSFGLMGAGAVESTLNERQSHYGEFKDVAETTAMLMDQFALGRMSHVQREALHMICSKLARIANGDPNHIDSWHDIAGYATLVVNDLES